MVLSKNSFCWKNSLATHICPTQQKSIMLCDVDVSCICTHGRCHVMLTSLALTHMARAARCWPNVLSSTAWPAVSPEIGPRFPRHGAGNRGSISGKTPPPEIGAQFKPRVGGIEPATFRLQAGVPPARPYIIICYIAIPSGPGPTKSKIQNPNSKRAVWILDFGVWILDFGFWGLEFGFWILDFGFWILDFGFWILDFGFWILDFGFWILDFGFWILDFGFWSLDFGFWVSLVFVLFVAAPNGAVWILDFGFWSLEFGFWILDFGVWSLEFGFWILEFGFWILDFGVWSLEFGFWILDFGLDEALPDIVWILHKIFPCHADSGRRIYLFVAFRYNVIEAWIIVKLPTGCPCEFLLFDEAFGSLHV